MPAASEEDRAYYLQNFGFPDIGCEHAITYLKQRGFKLTENWEWERAAEPDAKEAFLIVFLMEEWDFGGLAHGEERAE